MTIDTIKIKADVYREHLIERKEFWDKQDMNYSEGMSDGLQEGIVMMNLLIGYLEEVE